MKVTRTDPLGPVTKRTEYIVRVPRKYIDHINAALTDAEQRFRRAYRPDVAHRFAAIRATLPMSAPYDLSVTPYSWPYISRALRRYGASITTAVHEHTKWISTYASLNSAVPFNMHECRRAVGREQDPMPYFFPELPASVRAPELRSAATTPPPDLPLEVWENDPAEHWEHEQDLTG